MPPYVTDVSHPALVKWKRERQEYEDAIDARCAATDEDKLKVLRSIKTSFNRNLLKTLCKFEWDTTIEEVTAERIRSELDKIIDSVMNDDIIDVDVLFDQELKMDLREADVKARAKCKFLKQYLEPVALCDAVDSHHRLVDSSSKTDEQVLYQLVKGEALEQEKFSKRWAPYKKYVASLGRLVHVSPQDPERFYLRILLCHRRSPKSFEDICTLNGVVHETFMMLLWQLGTWRMTGNGKNV
ncbi:hypothetical protein PHMEG_0005983 [Phytophthora megakarya]|uniref:Uncharacterized protein n=1 Tax=Phytophthora megakarya TaxID=4795 RepID=A0A225WPT4_9STRA|nr:hypothetical protein PHMEG_0005983 [Phytophthora megakarya]